MSKKKSKKKFPLLKAFLIPVQKKIWKQKLKSFQKSLQKIGQKMYQQPGSQPQGEASQADGQAKPDRAKNEEPVEGEVVN